MTRHELLDEVFGRIAGKTGWGTHAGLADSTGWVNCPCPAHDDKSPSLGVKAGDKGILFKCQAGCSAEEVARALGFEMRELFYSDAAQPSGRAAHGEGRRSTTARPGRARPVGGDPRGGSTSTASGGAGEDRSRARVPRPDGAPPPAVAGEAATPPDNRGQGGESSHGQSDAPLPKRDPRHEPLTVDELARDKGLPAELLRECGVDEVRSGPHRGKVLIPYRLADGTDAPRQRLRSALAAKDGSSWRGAKGSGGLAPYGLWRLAEGAAVPAPPAAREAGPSAAGVDRDVFLVEGESDCWTLWHAGLRALGIPGATSEGCLELAHLEGAARVLVVSEGDEAGARFPGRVAVRLERIGWPAAPLVVKLAPAAKDPNAVWKRILSECGGEHDRAIARFRDEWGARVAGAVPWIEPTKGTGGRPLGGQGAGAKDGDPDRPKRRRAAERPDEVAELFLEDVLDKARAELDPRAPAPPGSASGDALPEGPDCKPRGLVYHRQGFYIWTGAAYRAVAEDELKARIVTFIREAGVGTPARQYVSNVLLNLTGIGNVPWNLDPPFRISTGEPVRDRVVFRNGVLDVGAFLRTGAVERSFAPHSSDLFTVNALGYEFDPAARWDRWHAFLAEVLPGEASRELLAEWFGYCLLPTQRYQRILLMQGAGANGKSVVGAVLRALVGPANCAAQDVGSLHERFALWPLAGKLVNFSAEFGHIDPRGEDALKKISGGDPVTVEAKNKDSFEAPLYARFVISSNNPPRITDRSEGLWRRLLILPFPVTIPPERQTPFDKLVAELCRNLPGVFNWALTGLARLRERGHFTDNAATAAAKALYRIASNPARAWCEEWLTLAPDGWVAIDAAYDSYLSYLKDNGHRRPLAKNRFGEEVASWRRSVQPDVSEKMLLRSRRRDSHSQRFYAYQGVSLRDEPLDAVPPRSNAGPPCRDHASFDGTER